MDGPLAQVLSSPRLVEFHDQIGRMLEAERTARLRFRDRVDEDRREEFINGEVVAQVSNRDKHTVCLDFIATLVTTFVRMRRLGSVRREQALTEFPRNDYCPDLCYWSADRNVGTDPEQVVYPPPDFIVEVLSPSTERRDRGVKLEDYESHGVREYWLVDPDRRTVEQLVVDGGRYRQAFAGSTGVIKSSTIAGFEMPVEAAFDDDAQLRALQAIVRGG
jgi:Uma2 family endonuclease